MKRLVTPNPIALLVATLAVAMGMTLGMSPSSGAADAPAKGAERLMKSAIPSAARQASVPRPVSSLHPECGPCMTVTTVRASETAKGGEVLLAHGKPTRLVSTHGCDGCSTSIGVTGFGKAKTRTVTHNCTMQAQVPSLSSCCR